MKWISKKISLDKKDNSYTLGYGQENRAEIEDTIIVVRAGGRIHQHDLLRESDGVNGGKVRAARPEYLEEVQRALAKLGWELK
ncbi:MAG TPA: hypothetical protein VMV90_08975 [Rectinemataceae bacterium]|nr:hypothetical protein [Rectinemataceae bacterium]